MDRIRCREHRKVKTVFLKKPWKSLNSFVAWRINMICISLLALLLDLEEEQAVVVQKEDMPQVGGRRLLRRIRALAGWPDDGTRYVYGVYIPDYDAVVFSLTDARPASEVPGYAE